MLDIGVWNPRAGLTAAGGTETFVRNISRELSSMDDVDVTLYTDTDKKTPAALSDVPIKRVPTIRKEFRINQLLSKTPLMDAEIESVSSYYHGRPAINTMDHDILTTHYYADALLLSRATDIPTVFRLPGIKQPSIRWKLLFHYGDVDEYIANSSTTVERVDRWYNRDLAGPVYAGVNPKRFQPADETVPNRILYVGRLGQGKGLAQLMHAAEQLPAFDVRIVGDGPLKPELDAMAPDNVEFVGTVPHSQVHREYQQASCFVLPSVHEGFAVCVIEALATGTPVVATRLDSTQLTVQNNETGILIGDREPDTIANAIDMVLQDDSYRAKARVQGRETALQYSWSEQASKFAEVLQNVA